MTDSFSGLSEFLVNTNTANEQLEASVTGLVGGGYVVTWQDYSGTLGDASESSIKAQIYNSDGAKVGGEFLVNTLTAGMQEGAQVVALSNGNFVVAWQNPHGSQGIWAQTYTPDGTRVGAQTLLKSGGLDHTIAALEDGGFVVTSRGVIGPGHPENGPEMGVTASVFDASGALVTSTVVASEVYNSSVTGLKTGGFVVAWQQPVPSTGGTAFHFDYRAQIYDASGAKVGPQLDVASYVYESLAMATLSNGNFVIIWDNDGSAVYGRMYTPDGVATDWPFIVSTSNTNTQSNPSITALNDGGFIVTWDDGSGALGDQGAGIKGQRFDATAAWVGSEFRINTTTAGAQKDPAVAVLADGSFVVAWSDYSSLGGDSSQSSIKAKLFEIQVPGDGVGTEGNDSLTGTAGNDSMDGFAGNDVIDGLGGNDTLDGGEGGDTLDGGDGDDLIRFRVEDGLVAMVDGGIGNDTLQGGISGGAATLDGGDGDDLFDIDSTGGNPTRLTGGTGQDTYSMVLVGNLFTITDFAAGDGGDVIDVPRIAQDLGLSSGADPFATGNLWLAQDGATTLLRYSRDGEVATLAVLPNVDSGALTAHNFMGYAPVIGGGGTQTGTPGNDSMIGSSGQDSIDGLAGKDTITGFDGNDTLNGGEGDDSLLGGEGNDSLNGGSGYDFVDGGAGDDTLDAGEGYDTVNGGDGNDLISGGSGIAGYRLNGDAGNDTIHGSDKPDAINGGDGDDLIHGNGGANNMNGAAGNDTLYGADLLDSVYGGAGDDVVSVYGGDDYVYGENGHDLIDAGAGNDIIEGNDGNDTIHGGDGNDLIRGDSWLAYAGNDYLDGGAGNDTMEGGMGNDTYVIRDAGDRASDVKDGGFDQILAYASAQAGNFIENVTLLGTDNILAYGNELNNVLIGNSGKNTLNGNAGNDTIKGGDGNDKLEGGAGDDRLFGEGGSDNVNGGEGSDSLEGGAGNDGLNGGARWDTLRGGEGNDILDGGDDNDAMYGGVGNDTYMVDHIGDRIYENYGEGTDTVKSSIDYALNADVEVLYLIEGAISGTGNGLSNSLNGSSGNNSLSGGLGNDSLYGWDGNDSLVGGNDHDRLSGGNGSDTLTGGHGNDVLGGGAGLDRFVFSSTAVNGHDHIVDFEHGLDHLVFKSSDYGFTAGYALSTAEFTAGTAAVGSSAQFVWDSVGRHLYFDADGDGAGAAIELAMISGGATVTKDDLTFT